MTVSIAPTVKINLRLSQRILRETAYDGFFALVVDGVQRIGKSSYVIKGLARASHLNVAILLHMLLDCA